MMAKRQEIIKSLTPFDVKIEEIITEIEDPSSFDIFSKTFDNIFIKIQEENQDSKILLNISSGTPQIKSSLCLEVVTSYLKLTPIQVLTPTKGCNENIAHGGEIEENLDDLMENGQYLTANRSIEANILSFKRASIKRDIRSLVNYYEYRAALERVEAHRELFDIEAITLIRYAKLRQNDNKEHKKNKWHSEFDYTKDVQANTACDYYCILSNKAKTGELSYFVLLLKSLAEYIAKNYIGEIKEQEAIDILNQYYMERNQSTFRPHYIRAHKKRQLAYNLEQYIHIIENKKGPSDELLKFKEILEQLETRRNNLAHELYREGEIDPNKSLKTLRHLIFKTFGNKVKEPSLALYENINKKINEIL